MQPFTPRVFRAPRPPSRPPGLRPWGMFMSPRAVASLSRHPPSSLSRAAAMAALAEPALAAQCAAPLGAASRQLPEARDGFLSGLRVPGLSRRKAGAARGVARCRMSMAGPGGARQLVLPPFQDKFLPFLAEAAQSEEGREQVFEAHKGITDRPPLLDLASRRMAEVQAQSLAQEKWTMMAAPAEVQRGGGSGSGYGEHRPRRPPPDLPSLLLHSRIVYIGMPLVPAVTELVVAQLLYLQWVDPRLPVFVYLNSTGTSRADGETVGMETEGFAIYDTMMQIRCEVQTVGVGAAIGQACMLLAAGKQGRRCMLPHATAMIQQPRLPGLGQMPAIDIQIRAREMINNRDTLVKLLAKHTGNSEEVVAKTMERPFYMNPQRAIDFGVIDKILWRGQEAMSETMSGEEWDKKAGIRVVEAS